MNIKHIHSDLIRKTKQLEHCFETEEGEVIILESFSNYDELSGDIGEIEIRVISNNKLYNTLSEEAKNDIEDIINEEHNK